MGTSINTKLQIYFIIILLFKMGTYNTMGLVVHQHKDLNA